VPRYPAQFQLVLVTKPCPCGRSGLDCACSPHARRRFLARITGLLLDRVDLRVRITTPEGSGAGAATAVDGATLRARVREARARAAERWAIHGGSTNADVPARTFTNAEFRLARKATAPLDRALEIGALSARGGVRALRVAWTLADLASLGRPGRDEITQALEFRDRRPETA
jgi:magnesium chelatase family protein